MTTTTTTQVRYLADVWTSSVNKHAVEGEVPVRLCNYTDVYKGDTVAPSESLMRATATPAEVRRYHLQHGDSVLTKDSEDPSDIGISAFVTGTAKDFVCGYHLAIARPRAGTHPRYLSWALRTRPALSHFSTHASGISRYGLGIADLRATPIPIHDLSQQVRIANFLDDRVARIDQIVAARQAQIGRLEDSLEAEWHAIGEELLKRGRLVPIRRFLRSIVDGPFGSSLTSSHYSDSGVRVVRLGNIGIARFRNVDVAFITEEHGADLAGHAVRPGDILMAGLGDERWPLGRCAIAPDDLGPAIVKADCYRIRLDERVGHRYAAMFMSGPQARSAFNLLARGATRARLNTDVARAAEVPFASQADQQQYVTRVSDAMARRDVSQRQLESSISLLREYKQSLITAAVAGELDVTGAGSGIPG